MVSESNTNRRHFKISNTHDQIHYNNNTSKHLYLKVFKYFLKYLYLMFRN